MKRDRRGPPTSRGEWQLWPEAAAPTSALGREFLRYWHSKCPEGAFPCRSDIRPEELRPLLPHFMIVDVIDHGAVPDYRFRLVGTAIVRLEGEHTGKLLSDIFTDRQIYEVPWRHYNDAAAGRIQVRHGTLHWLNRGHLGYEAILAPLQDDSGEIVMLIGLAHAPGD